MQEQLNIVYKPLRQLKPYKNNAKKHNKEQVEQIANSIKEFGFTQPVIIDENNVVVAGHGRILGAKKAGLKQVPTVMLSELTEEQIKAYRLVDNKLNESEWDYNLLDDELSVLEQDIDMELFGFDMFKKEKDVVEDEDFEMEIPTKPKSKIGEIYKLGNHRLMCGDSTNIEHVRKLMDGIKADISFTSPPYNIGGSHSYEKKSSKYENDEDNKKAEEYTMFLKRFTECAIKFSKYSFVNIQSLANNKISLIEYLSTMKKFYSDTIIWDKGHTSPAMARRVMNSSFEYIHIFSNDAKRSIGTRDFRGTVSNIIHISPQRKK